MDGTTTSSAATWAGLAAGLVVTAAAYGISKIAIAALDNMARQPEIANKIQTAMLIAAALIEGVALFCAFICYQSLSG